MKTTKRQLRLLIESTLSDSEKKELEGIVEELKKASEMHASQAERVQSFIDNAANLDESNSLHDTDLLREYIRGLLVDDVRKRGNEYCAYVDDKLTKAEKENNPKAHKGKKVGSIQRTKSGKPRMKARACYKSKKKANNAMAAAMMG